MKFEICRQIDELGRVVIPGDLRRQYGLKPGGKVWFSAYDDGILIHSEDYTYNNDDNKKKTTEI
ncbi:MAG: AbrB/MazE/SpoVT family DNA-binding domain-containing protein [Clostridia bacterium]|nr:AbrB/MazE/SpoVT family DNA-binding domain-containing protein [Clostridia bacterium]